MTAKNAPAESFRRIPLTEVLVYELRVRDAMTKDVITASPDHSLRSIQELMKQHRISGVPIIENGKLVGIVSIEDIINALDKGYINEPARKWMTRNPVVLRDYYSLVRAVNEFDLHGFGRFPVVDVNDQLVGIITRGDITNCLMHKLAEKAEAAIAHETALAARLQRGEEWETLVKRVPVRAGDFDNAGKTSNWIRQVLRERGVDPDVRRRAAIVAYEAETNMIIHSVGGELSVEITSDKVVIDAIDQGPGIENLELAMQEGWSTAGPLARQLGFGAGMGLPNIKRCSDRLSIKTEMGVGTHLHAEVDIEYQQEPKAQYECTAQNS